MTSGFGVGVFSNNYEEIFVLWKQTDIVDNQWIWGGVFSNNYEEIFVLWKQTDIVDHRGRVMKM